MRINFGLTEVSGGDSPTGSGERATSGEITRFSERVRGPKLEASICIIVLAGSCLLYFAALAPERFGFYHDDGIYAVMAKSLASGHGYRIISLPDTPVQTKSPPLYPFLLSLVWRVYPQFPKNLILMMMLSAVATLSFLALSYRLLVTNGHATTWQALIVMVLVAVNWRTTILATGIYSEMIYGTLSVAGLCLGENYEKAHNNWIAGIWFGLAMGLAFLTRSSGVALLIAVAVYFVLRRQWCKAVLPLLIGCLFALGWAGWVWLNHTTVENVTAGSYESYFRTFGELLTASGGNGNTLTLITFLSLVGKNAVGLLVSVPVVCLGLAYDQSQYFGFAFFFVAAGFIRHSRRGFRLLHAYVICYVALHLFWPYTSYDRFLMPLLPFLLLFLITEVEGISLLVRREIGQGRRVFNKISAAIVGLALVASVGVVVYNYGSGILESAASASLRKTAGPASEDAEAIGWINEHTDPSDVLICYRDPLYYLYTGRKGVQSSLSRGGSLLQSQQTAIDDKAKVLLRAIAESKGRYLILSASDFDLEYQPELQRQSARTLVEQNPQMFVAVFESTDGRSAIYRIQTNAEDTVK
jgi:4-amino-4-deoxy-L-arabinose transferase-like glycosyltransferase